MAEALRELATDAVTGEKGSSTYTTQMRKRKRAAVVKRPRRIGSERLRHEASKVVGLNSKRIARMLSGKAVDGHLPTLRYLVELADGEKQPEKKRTGPTATQELEMEEEWVGPMEGLGNRD